MNGPAAGVGLTYFSELEPLFTENSGLVDVLEIEPQVYWEHIHRDPDAYRVDAGSLARMKSFPQPKLLHSLGSIGGSHSPNLGHVPQLLKMKRALRPLWITEHLSFNTAAGPNGLFKTGFFLPLRQNPLGVKTAARAIRSMASHLGVRLAVETGVNYLKPRDDEMRDGEFVAAVADAADCGLLLDMHNIWTNQRNGRQTVGEFLRDIPLDRVWEVHVAGGFEEDGYWLDAHSGEMQEEMLDLAKGVIPTLPNLRAIVFEINPSFLPQVGLEAVRRQLKTVRRLWGMRGMESSSTPPVRLSRRRAPRDGAAKNSTSPTEWENTLGALVVGAVSDNDLANDLAADPGVALYRKLIASFRASMVVRNLKLTSRLLLLNVGKESFSRMLERFWKERTPELFASDEAEGFADYLRSARLGLPYLNEILEFETSVQAATLHGETRVVTFPYDPFPVLRALGQRKMPASPTPGNFELVITPDEAKSTGRSGGGATTSAQIDRHRQLVWHH